jgi:hypothetical protein
MFRPYEHPMNIEEISAAATALITFAHVERGVSIREVLERSNVAD